MKLKKKVKNQKRNLKVKDLQGVLRDKEIYLHHYHQQKYKLLNQKEIFLTGQEVLGLV